MLGTVIIILSSFSVSVSVSMLTACIMLSTVKNWSRGTVRS